VGAEVLAVVAGFVAVDEIERAGIVAESAEGERGTGGGILRGVRGFGAFAHFMLHGSLFNAPEPHLTPTGNGHVFDEGGFDVGLRLEFFVESGEEPAEAVLGLAFEDDGAGEHAVSYGVAGGGLFALRGDWASGFGSIGAGSLGLTFGTHTTYLLHARRGDFGGLRLRLLMAWEI